MTVFTIKKGQFVEVETHDCYNCVFNTQRKKVYPQIVACTKHNQVYIGGEETTCPDYRDRGGCE